MTNLTFLYYVYNKFYKKSEQLWHFFHSFTVTNITTLLG